MEQFFSKNLAYLKLFGIIALNGNRGSSGNRLLFLFLILHALLQKKQLCHLEEQFHFWWYSNLVDLRPYNYRGTVSVDT